MFTKPYDDNKKRSQSYAQHFDRKAITITKGGKTYNLYDSIQAAREDTEIYPTLEKYGCLKPLERDVKLVYKDLSEALDLRDLYNQDIKLQELFENLPAKQRNLFDNDFYKFKQNGLEVFSKIAEEEIKAKQKINNVDNNNNAAKDQK